MSMLCARFVCRARGLVSALFAPVPQVNLLEQRSMSGNGNDIRLGDVIEALVKSSSPAHEDRVKRLRIISELQQSLGKADLGPTIDLRILPFGSFVNSLYEPNSDLDLAIVGQIVATDDLSPDDKRHPFLKLQLAKLPREYVSELLRTAVARFVKDGLADEKSLVPVLHARIPIVKFVHPTTGINVDVCVGSEGDPFKTWSLAQLMAVHPAVDKLCRVVKIWAKAHGINDPKSFTFNSWCLTLLVVFFLQRHSVPELLPPLKAIMGEKPSPRSGPAMRLMHGGRQPPSKLVVRLMGCVTKNLGPARGAYGNRPAKPLEDLFLDFLESNSKLLRAAVENKEPLKRGVAISVFHGDFHREYHFRRHPLFVEDPLNDLDNTARTLRVSKRSGGSTLKYVTTSFSESARRLRGHLEASPPPTGTRALASPAPGPGEFAEPAATTAHSNTQPSSPFFTATTEPRVESSVNSMGNEASCDRKDAPTSSFETASDEEFTPNAPVLRPVPSSSEELTPSGAVKTAAPIAGVDAVTCAAPTAAVDVGAGGGAGADAGPLTAPGGSGSETLPTAATSLAATAVFLFGTELITRLPDLSDKLLGGELCDWARGELAAGQPAGLVHAELLKKLGARGGFEPFVSFKKRCGIRMLDEEEHWTPEELELLIGEQVRKQAVLGKEAGEKPPRRRVQEDARHKQQPRGRREATAAASRNWEGPRAKEGGLHIEAAAAETATPTEINTAGSRPPQPLKARSSRGAASRGARSVPGGAATERPVAAIRVLEASKGG